MRHRWVNLLLLALIAGEGVTGAIGLMSGNPRSEFILQAHSILGYAILATLGWKVALALSSLSKPSRGRPRAMTLTLVAFFLAAMCIGLAWSVSGYWHWSGITGMSLHIYSGVVVLGLAAWHAWAYTSRFRVGYSKERRDALRLGAVLAVGAVAWGATETLLRSTNAVGARRRFTGSYERGSMQGNRFPTTSWLNDAPTPIDSASYTLRIVGTDGAAVNLTPGELAARLGEDYVADMEATLDCTGGWYSRQVWSGATLDDIFRAADLDVSEASACVVTSVTGYSRRYPVNDFGRLLLATHVGNEPISHGHGAPMRLVAPNRRGYDWVKWVTEVRLTASPAWFQPWLPLQ